MTAPNRPDILEIARRKLEEIRARDSSSGPGGERCECCIYWLLENESGFGVCRRRAPVVNEYTEFPTMHRLGWCGEFHDKELPRA